MTVVPDELAEVVHRAAAATAEYRPDVAGIERRWHRRRRRRAVTCAAGVAVLAAVSLAAVPQLNRGRGPDRTPPAAAEQPAQRLMVGGSTWTPMGREFIDGRVVHRPDAVELLPDGTAKLWPLPDLDVIYQVIGRPDGRLVVLDLPETRDRETTPELTLRVVSPSGAVESATPAGTGDVSLVAVTADTAYLWREEGIVAYTLATGAHRLHVPAGAIGMDPFSGPGADADLLGETLVVATGLGGCRLRVIDVGGHAKDHSLTRQACDVTGRVRISPDGRLAALTYSAGNGPERVAVIDLATGASRVDAPIQALDSAGAPVHSAGMAWQDATRLRVAVMIPPPDPGRTYDETDLVRQQIIDV